MEILFTSNSLHGFIYTRSSRFLEEVKPKNEKVHVLHYGPSYKVISGDKESKARFLDQKTLKSIRISS